MKKGSPITICPLLDEDATATIELVLHLNSRPESNGLPVDLGAMTLSVDKRNCILDSQETNWEIRGKKLTIETDLEFDVNTFNKGKDYNYLLTEEDLINALVNQTAELKTSFYCAESDEEEEGFIDFEKSTAKCTLYVNNNMYTFNVNFE